MGKLCLSDFMASTAVFNGALSASPGFVLMRLFLLDLVALSNHHADVFNGGGAMSA